MMSQQEGNGKGCTGKSYGTESYKGPDQEGRTDSPSKPGRGTDNHKGEATN